MIEEYLSNTSPMYISGMSSGIVATTVAGVGLTSNIQLCIQDCDYTELAFYNSDLTNFKNDKTSVLVKKEVSSEVWAFVLEKNGVFVANLNSNTYGDYWDFGTLKYSYYKGICIDWKKVADAFGNGVYRILIKKTLGSTVESTYTHYFRVMPFACEEAEGTIKIESWQNGDYANGAVFRDMNWYQSIRVRGRFGMKKPVLASEEYITSGRQREQVLDKIVNTYTFETGLIPSSIYNEIIYGQGLSNKLLITDYGRFSPEMWRQYAVKLTNIQEIKQLVSRKFGKIKLDFTDRSEGTIKGY